MLNRFRLTRRSFSALAFSLGLFGVGRPERSSASDGGAGEFDVVLESDVRVAVRDGVKLATDRSFWSVRLTGVT
jgi:hypothetical protein